MRLKLQKLKKDLQTLLFEELKELYKNYFVAKTGDLCLIRGKLNNQSYAFLFDLKKKTSNTLEVDSLKQWENKVSQLDLSPIASYEQQSIHALILALATAQNGYQLWEAMQKEIKKQFPNKLYYILGLSSPLYSLALKMNGLLSDFSLKDLQKEDIQELIAQSQNLHLKNQVLNLKISSLEDEKNSLMMKYNEARMSHETFLIVNSKHMDKLINDKKELAFELSNALTYTKELEEQQATLMGHLTELNEENSTLRQKVAQHAQPKKANQARATFSLSQPTRAHLPTFWSRAEASKGDGYGFGNTSEVSKKTAMEKP